MKNVVCCLESLGVLEMKNLLEEIQQDIVNKRIDVTSILRKAKMLAHKLKSDELKNWVDLELRGYSEIDKISYPSYRKLHTSCLASFSDGYSKITDAPISETQIEKTFRDYIFKAYMHYPVGEVYDIYQSQQDDESVKCYLNHQVIDTSLIDKNPKMSCVQAYQVISKSRLMSIVDEVLTNLLTFTLEIMDQLNIDSEDFNFMPDSKEKIHQTFNMTINGGQNNISNAGQDFTQNVNNNVFDEALQELSKIKSDESEQAAKIIRDMQANTGKPKFGELYHNLTTFLANHTTIGTVMLPFMPTFLAFLGL